MPITSLSKSVPIKQLNASRGVLTIGSPLTLKDVLTKIGQKNKDKYFLLKVFKKNNKYLLIKNDKFNFLKNLIIFLMDELIEPKNFTQKLNFKMSNMNMNIKIEYNNAIKPSPLSYWIDPKKLRNYTLPSFTKKIVLYLENNK